MKKILVIEDNKDILSNIRETLELATYSVFTAENGKAGIEQALEVKPDLIICDIMMPELDGYGVLYVVQHNPMLQNIPFVFLTAKTDPAEIRKGMALGADDYLTKPFDIVDLLCTVENRFRKVEVMKKQFTGDTGGVKKFLSVEEGDNLLRTFVEGRQIDKYHKKQKIFTQGNYPVRLYYLQRGKVKIFKTNGDGKELIIRISKEGDFFGYIALLEDTPYQATAEAMEECEIAAIPRSEFEELMNSHPEVSKRFIKMLARDVLTMEEHLIHMAYNSIRRKVADALLTVQEKFKVTNDKQNISISRENLAAIAGTATESLIRTLSDFKNEKLIDVQDGKITILNRDLIQKMVN